MASSDFPGRLRWSRLSRVATRPHTSTWSPDLCPRPGFCPFFCYVFPKSKKKMNEKTTVITRTKRVQKNAAITWRKRTRSRTFGIYTSGSHTSLHSVPFIDRYRHAHASSIVCFCLLNNHTKYIFFRHKIVWPDFFFFFTYILFKVLSSRFVDRLLHGSVKKYIGYDVHKNNKLYLLILYMYIIIWYTCVYSIGLAIWPKAHTIVNHLTEYKIFTKS